MKSGYVTDNESDLKTPCTVCEYFSALNKHLNILLPTLVTLYSRTKLNMQEKGETVKTGFLKERLIQKGQQICHL